MFLWLHGVTRFIEDRDIRLLTAELDTAIKPPCEHAAASRRHERFIICPFFTCMVGNNHADTVHVDQHIDTIQEFAYLCVGILFAVEEVNYWVDHDEIGFVKLYLLAELFDVLVAHQVLSQPAADDQVAVPHGQKLLVKLKAPIVSVDTPLQKLCDDLSLEPHHLEWAAELDIHEVCPCRCPCREGAEPVRLTNLGFAQQQHPTLLKDERIAPVLFDAIVGHGRPLICVEGLQP